MGFIALTIKGMPQFIALMAKPYYILTSSLVLLVIRLISSTII